ncbi:MAG TPA: MEDS domain-containing protein [Nitrososphaerales archaeon]|nr:MEDS domain-containing protein [Nitrososphaerales archaeon]
MSAENTDYHPVKFLDELQGNNHIVLLYDDEKFGDLMIARYFLNGLKKEQSCIFFTDEDPGPMEERLEAQGLDIQKYREANQFRIYRSHPPNNVNVEVLEILKAIRAEATRGMRGPFRFAGRTIMDIQTTDGMLLRGMEVERTGQAHFPEFDNAQMCFYDIRKLEPTRKVEWIEDLLKNHHQVIYASSPEKAVAFESGLLETED